jgi:uncharacterized protein DUF6920
MKRWVKVSATVAGGVAVSTVAAATIGAARWNRATARMVDRLTTPTRTHDIANAASFSAEQLAGLPAPVVRYFTFALTPGQPLIRRARVRWAGEFRSRPDGKWSPFTAVQHFAVRPPGFVWDATIRMTPFLPVRVRDGYVAGEGTMVGKLGALVRVVDEHGTPAIAASALSRYLAEAVWIPTALLPTEGVSWAPIDDSTARASVTDGATTVSADFHFGPRGEIVGTSMMRHRDVNGRGVPTPFEGRYNRDYRRVSGMMIPPGAEVEWVLPEGRFTYWRGRVESLELP